MKPCYKPATDTDIGECVNLMPDIFGNIKHVEATKNAVVTQVFENEDDDGVKTISRIVHIECVDESLYPALKEEARRILKI